MVNEFVKVKFRSVDFLMVTTGDLQLNCFEDFKKDFLFIPLLVKNFLKIGKKDALYQQTIYVLAIVKQKHATKDLCSAFSLKHQLIHLKFKHY